MRIVFWILLGFSIIIILVGLSLYFFHFNNGYSNDQTHWGVFGDYINIFLNFASLIILGYISFVTFRTTDTFNRLQIRPILFITLDKPEQIVGSFKDSWYVVNGAKNTALNLIVRFTDNRNSGKFTKWVSCTSLSENQRLELFWIHWADEIEICFTDLTKERFYLFKFMDFNGDTREITRHQYTEFLQQAIENRNNNMTHLRDKLEEYIFTENSKGINPMSDYTINFIAKNIMD